MSRRYVPTEEIEKMISGYSPIISRMNAPLKPGITRVAPLMIPAIISFSRANKKYKVYKGT